MHNCIDLSSDTATKPTPEMLSAMMAAPTGDEQKGEDPTTNKLESLVAEKFGFESAMFCPSATMANQIAIRALCEPGDALIAASNSHILQSEFGGSAIHAQVMSYPVITATGIFSADDVREFCNPQSIKSPPLRLLCVENTTNIGGGRVWPKQALSDVLDYANKLGLKKHLDGARIFNASVKIGLPVDKLCAEFDMITVCLTKGLGCPVGALLVFNKIYESKLRRLKHLMGGAMRQTGILAAAGIYALERNVERLADDHSNALLLASELNKITGIEVVNSNPETNIVIFRWVGSEMSPADFHKRCNVNNVRFSKVGIDTFRGVTHMDVARRDVLEAIGIVQGIVSNTASLRDRVYVN